MKTFLVGGAVRDRLLGIDPKDLDYVVVGGTPDQMLKLGFIQVGVDFPVFLDPQHNHEYALARLERKIGKGYNGFATEIQNVTLCDDLARRDLTINSMAMDDEGQLYDPFNGKVDLEARVLRHTSDAFAEDPLRVVRLGRFFARYNFHIADETFDLARKMVERGDLNQLSIERFWTELNKIFLESRPDLFFSLLYQLDGDLHIEFFRNVYGSFSDDPRSYSPRLTTIKDLALAVGFARPEDRVRLHVALAGKHNAMLTGADSRTTALHANVQRLRKLQRTPSSIFELLKVAKAWSDGPATEDLWKAIVFANMAGETFAISQQELRAAVKATAAITSANFTDQYKPGKELGVAIEEGRKAALQKTFNLQDDETPAKNEL